jgi:DNA replication protein DnaC
MSFVDRAHDVIVLGPPHVGTPAAGAGAGETHLAIAPGIKAEEAGYSVLLPTLEELIGRLLRAAKESRLEYSLQQLTYPEVLIIDEIGHPPLSSFEASLFFRLVVRRYERASIVATSNRSFLNWGGMFSDTVLATAIPDRLLHCPTTLNTPHLW